MSTKQTVQEYAQEWRISPQTVYKLIKAGALDATRVPGTRRLVIDLEESK